MAHRTPTVRDGCLQDLAMNENTADTLFVGSAEWFAWLEYHCSFRFETDCAAFTARKEQRPGGWYWYAYRRKQGKLCSIYLGKSEELTLDRLSLVAENLEYQHQDEGSILTSALHTHRVSRDNARQIYHTSLDRLPATVAIVEQITKPEPASLHPSTKLQDAEINLQAPLESIVLTRREQEVLSLVTMGLTNAQIAERLVVSVSTINTHVRSIYNKLEVTSRSAATRYAIEHHLV
jgi:DNA-binding CsgD family transcriptional regulator/IS1 family transposase